MYNRSDSDYLVFKHRPFTVVPSEFVYFEAWLVPSHSTGCCYALISRVLIIILGQVALGD